MFHQNTAMSYYCAMSDTEVKSLIYELKTWCKEKHGRNAQIAEMLGVSRQLVSDWFSGSAVPTWKTGLKIQAFLKKRYRSTFRMRKIHPWGYSLIALTKKPMIPPYPDELLLEILDSLQLPDWFWRKVLDEPSWGWCKHEVMTLIEKTPDPLLPFLPFKETDPNDENIDRLVWGLDAGYEIFRQVAEFKRAG
jgi:transcriptional regulator with XRE-family HTH domain